MKNRRFRILTLLFAIIMMFSTTSVYAQESERCVLLVEQYQKIPFIAELWQQAKPIHITLLLPIQVCSQ